ncbi:MAG TPA: twin-arginine translocase subunit TatC [Thermodesulfobacteriota bacterium]
MTLPTVPAGGTPGGVPAKPRKKKFTLPIRPPGLPPPPKVDEKLPFTAHLAELRIRLIYSAVAIGIAFGICFWQSERLVALLVAPLAAVLPPESPIVFTRLTEPFWTYTKLAFFSALFFASPVWLVQAWAFVAPGLYDNERRVVLPLVALSVAAFIVGGAFCYFVAFPQMFRFFLSFQTPYLLAAPSISEYLSLTSKLVLAFGAGFEFPVAILLLARLGAVTAEKLRRVRGYAVFGIFVLAAVVTPPDLVSQLLFAVPMIILYEIGIWVAWLAGRRRPERPAEEPPESPHQPPPGGAASA